MAQQSDSGGLKLVAVEPTVFFVHGDGGLRQLVNCSIDNAGPAVQASVTVRFGSRQEQIPIEAVCPGTHSYPITIPDIREPMSVEFVLSAAGRTQEARTMEWTPQRHWQIYIVHTSHHDLGYTDLPSNVLREHDEFMDQILQFCEQTADWPAEARFHYSIEQAWSIVHYVRNRPPETVEKLVRFMREGRIELTALFGNQISELCSHEELIRLLYPAFWLKRRYGVPLCSAELNDVPGLSWGLASVLAGAGIRYFCAGLPDYHLWGDLKVHGFWDDSTVMPRGKPDAFWWVGPDGARVLLWYGTSAPLDDYDRALHHLPGKLAQIENQGYPFDLVRFYVLGGHRDNSPPRICFSEVVRQWNRQWAYPKLIFTTNAVFFERLERQHGHELRTFRGELPNTDYTVGATCTAKETGINRATHDTLRAAETFATVAAGVSDYDYPARQIDEAYEKMLLYDEHTWGMAHPLGPAQDGCWGFKAEHAYRAAGLAHDVLTKSLNRIVDQIALADEGCHVVVFNPLSWPRTDVVRLPLRSPAPCSLPMHTRPRPDAATPELVAGTAIGRSIIEPPTELIERGFELIELATGRSVPYQIVELFGPDAPEPYASHRYAVGQYDPAHLRQIVFVAEDVPALGCKTYRLVPHSAKLPARSSITLGETTMENRFYRIRLDPESGTVVSIFDKQLERELIDPSAPHGLGELVVREAATARILPRASASIRKGEHGPVCASLIVTGQSPGCPQRTQQITLYEDLKRIDLATRLLKDATPMLEFYLAWPFRADPPQFHYEGCHSVVEPLRDQFPGSNTDNYTVQHWANVSDGRISITLAPIESPVTAFGGLWPGYVTQAHHGVTPPDYGHEFLKPGQMTKAHLYSYLMTNNFRTNFQPMQVGEAIFRYSITSGPGDWRGVRARDFGWAIGSPLIPVCMNGPKSGELPAQTSFARVDPPNVLLLTLKRAEDGDGLIARLIETEGRGADVRLELPFVAIAEARANSLVEQDLGAVPARDHTVRTSIKPFGVATIRIRPEPQ